MAYLNPAEFVTKMVDSGESKLLMSTRDTLIRSYMAGAILALAAAFAVTCTSALLCRRGSQLQLRLLAHLAASQLQRSCS